MRILYGVQATGQGHISRARAMAQALSRHPVKVDWLFSGRPREQLFDMEPFGSYTHRRGLTFTTHAGQIRYFSTVIDNNIFRFISDVRELDVSAYDVIVTDFEPVTAWAGRVHRKATIGIGHQYAFGHGQTPARGDDWLSRLIMRNFAPVDMGLGLHWHPYNSHTLPPILDLEEHPASRGDFTLVYLPFEDQNRVTLWLSKFSNYNFVQYAASIQDGQMGNVLRRKANIAGFKQHLSQARGVICNSGFELISECLQLGKPVLTKPMGGQMEQLSNALALEQLSYATTMQDLDTLTLGHWLEHTPGGARLDFPDVAAALAGWLARGCDVSPAQLSAELWGRGQSEPQLPDSPLFQPRGSAVEAHRQAQSSSARGSSVPCQ